MPLLPDLPKAEIAIIEMTNAFRRSSRLGTLAGEPALKKAARDYAQFLAASPIFNHEADGRHPQDRIKAAGYAACSTAENLAWFSDPRGFETADLAQRMVEGWEKSPPHRKNMLIEHVTETGVALAKVKGADKYIGVQLFGRPQSHQYELQIENASGRSVSYTLSGQKTELRDHEAARTRLCEPAEIAFEISTGGLLGKAEIKRFKTEGGQIYRLTREPGGATRVDVEKKQR